MSRPYHKRTPLEKATKAIDWKAYALALVLGLEDVVSIAGAQSVAGRVAIRHLCQPVPHRTDKPKGNAA